MADNELFAKLQRRNQMIESAEEGQQVDLPTDSVSNNNLPKPSEPELKGDLAEKLQRRNEIIDGDEQGLEPKLPSLQVFNPYTEFKEFSRKQIQGYQRMFNEWVQIFL